jgi:hypothetical protein
LGKTDAEAGSITIFIAVPELPRSAGIKLNIRVLLQRTLETLIIFAVVQDWPNAATSWSAYLRD